MWMDEKKKEKRRALFIGAAFLLAWFGGLLILFPVGNLFETVVSSRVGMVIAVAALLGVGLSLVALLYFAMKWTVLDFFDGVCAELGIDGRQIARDYKQLLKDEFLMLIGKKSRPSEHHYDEE